jgi:hypothetical protein
VAFTRFGEAGLDLYVGDAALKNRPILAASAVRSPARWSGNGREVYYIQRDGRMMAIPISADPALALNVPKALFGVKPADILLDVSRDDRFLLLISQVRAGTRPVVVSTAAVQALQ